ncbi:MAG: hypothetical protein ACYCPT_01855 [Acidimicrobiales bacterium]
MSEHKSAKTDDAIEFEAWQGESGGTVDAWWTPEKGSTLQGIIVGYIPMTRSEKLKSDSVLIELLSPATHCTHSGSDKIEGKKGDEVEAPKGAVVGVPVWKQIEGLYPSKIGFAVKLTMLGETKIVGRSPMKNFQIQTSTRQIRAISAPAPTSSKIADGEAVPFDV